MSAHKNKNPEQYVENYIGYTFKDRAILREAVEQSENKRLGFLGDKVIGLLLLDAWYRTHTSCDWGNHQLQLYGSNREMASEARIARFDRYLSSYARHHTHALATEVEAIIGAVWVDSGRNWEVTGSCYARIKDHGTTDHVVLDQR
ncbi:hypothetical protein BJX76DRAFT_361578 [Aspergillus varians]